MLTWTKSALIQFIKENHQPAYNGFDITAIKDWYKVSEDQRTKLTEKFM